MTPNACPHSRAFANTTLLEEEGETIHLCPDCKSARLEGTDTWIPARYGMTDYLRSLVLPARKASEDRDHAAMYSPDNDPRWERFTL